MLYTLALTGRFYHLSHTNDVQEFVIPTSQMFPSKVYIISGLIDFFYASSNVQCLMEYSRHSSQSFHIQALKEKQHLQDMTYQLLEQWEYLLTCKISCVLNSTNILLVGEDSVTLTVNMSNLIREHFVKMVDSSFRIAMLIKEIHSGSTSTSPRWKALCTKSQYVISRGWRCHSSSEVVSFNYLSFWGKWLKGN